MNKNEETFRKPKNFASLLLVLAAKQELAESRAAKELRFFMDCKSVADIEPLKPWLADDIVYANRGMGFELKGKEAVTQKLEQLSFVILDGADALFAMITKPVIDEDRNTVYEAGTPCIALKYVRDAAPKVHSLAFFETDDDGLITRLETAPAGEHEFILFYPPNWKGWSKRVEITTVEYNRDGTVKSRYTRYSDGTPVKEENEDVDAEN